MSAQRIQLSRAKGWRLPENARSVAWPTAFANPWRPDKRGLEANSAAVDKYRVWLSDYPALVERARAELTGYDLACWCPPDLPCHADVLLNLLRQEQS